MAILCENYGGKWYAAFYVVFNNYVALERGAKYCDKHVCLSLRSDNFKTAWLNLTKFLCMLLAAVARSTSGGVVILYVLSVCG